MAGKHKKPAPSGGDLAGRVARARAEGRTMQALDLARQLAKAEPTEQNKALVFDVSLERARQLRGQGQARDAATVADNAAALGGPPERLERAVAELLACGAPELAGRHLAALPEARRAAFLPMAADAAILSGGKGCPPALTGELAAVRAAFAHHAAGREAEAREAMRPVGLSSPFAEWRLLLRGLQAYHANDDAGANEAWRRLTPSRLPARIAAPFRSSIDAEYRKGLPMPEQARNVAILTRVQGPTPRADAERLLRHLAANEPDEAVRVAASVLPALRASAPALAARFTRALYWAALDGGPHLVRQLRSSVGAVEDDPSFNRINAIGWEMGKSYPEANRHWLAYAKEIEAGKVPLSPREAEAARGLIWLRMGQNAAQLPTEKEIGELPAFMREFSRHLVCDPPAEACFREAIRLLPEHDPAHDGLINFLGRLGMAAEAAEAARVMIRHLPDSLSAHRHLGRYCEETGDRAGAVTHLRAALRLKPLDEVTRAGLGHALFRHAADLAPEQAGPLYAEARALCPPWQTPAIDASWSALLTKAGREDEARERLALAAAAVPAPLVLTHLLVVESARHGWPAPARKPLVADFNAGVALPLAPAAACALARNASLLKVIGPNYHGEQAHCKKVAEAALAAGLEGLPEEAVGGLLEAMLDLGPPVRKMWNLLDDAAARFPKSYMVPYCEARFVMKGDEPDPDTLWRITPLITRTLDLVRQAPPSPLATRVREGAEALQRMIDALGFGGLDDFDYGDDEYEDDDFDDPY